MTPQSPAAAPDPSSPPATARVIPFERPQSEAQRAVQQRAQEAMELNRARSKFRVTPLRWALIFAVATIPAFLTSAAMDGILRGMHLLDAMYDKQDAERAAHQPPAADVQEQEPQEPGVVMLRPVAEAPAAEGGKASSTKGK